ncbi:MULTISPECIES: glycoside hydrolase family 15 protein [unclassified Amycolatopsis]|uniref:glycoside hydrolase family 15 protein n=1 Tax=unclassified Amycolatopsis TaxID=2618356 RepID=UPI002875D090|nr:MULTISPECIES: glycoside hydrolase family 15 protein [unclassified Amycolatopsis]MDS0140347.1 glycoside hydrolase family 15 protein [Amycolatopsis sp. 505]MDS0149049.1 glycoside hydrolase family 15 protein [Amycolatopsis sp. CM201R]
MTETTIAEHGLIGDLQTAALVTTDGSIDWFCAPRFDSPSVFGALLDDERGGRFRIRPASATASSQMYHPDTAVLITRFAGPDGLGEVVDFMPPCEGGATTRHRIARLVRCVRGRMTFDVVVAPRFDYGRRPHQAMLVANGAVFIARETSLALHAVREPGDEHLADVRVEGGDVHLQLTLTAGQVRGVVLETDAAEPPRELRVAEFEDLFRSTVDWWRGWLARSTYRGRWREIVARSAITLKLLTYAPTGGLVAAPTLGLPEQLGGERNWDYRYTWVRDASFSVSALLSLGFAEEAARFGSWLGDRIREGGGGTSGPLAVLYRVDGTSDLREESLAHWSGYRGSSPVRIGNDAAGQLQLDIYGEALDSVFAADRAGFELPHQGWEALRAALDWLGEHWDQPEEGIWETRGGRKRFTYGRLMSWVAFDRGIRLAAVHGRPAPVEDWTWQRDSIHGQLLARGWHRTRNAFVQHDTGEELDAALLRMPRTGFLPPKDPLWLSTLDAIQADLVTDSLVYRYDPAVSPDGLAGSEGTFSLCSFAYVDALARADRLEEARTAFEKMLTYANHVGLYAEEIAPTGEQLGNFPQAFTHLALIDAAVTLDTALG